MLKKFGYLISILFFLIGGIGFLGGALISTGSAQYSKELPLSEVEGFVVDDSGNIYIGLGFYGMVQVYDKNGEFQYNWHVDASGGTFKITLNDEQNIVISTARGDKQITYAKDGKLLSSIVIDNVYSTTNSNGSEVITSNGEKFELNGLFPKIAITQPEYKVIVSQGVFHNMMKGPFPVWLFIGFGFGIFFYLNRDKLKEQIEKERNRSS